MKALLSTIVGVIFSALPALAANVTSPVLHAVVVGVGAVVGVFIHHQASSTKMWNGNPFGSITVSALVTAVVGFFASHLDPSQLTPLGTAVWGVLGAVIGTLTHHAVLTTTNPAQ